jgi:putative ABC transport system permease protein
MTFAARRSVFAAVSGGLHEALRGRSLLAIVAIAFGVALGYAVHLVNASAVRELASGIAVLSGSADLEVRGPRHGFSQSVYPGVARDRDVIAASPVVEVDAKLAGRRETLPILGVDVFRAIAITPSLVGIGEDRLDTLRTDALFPSPGAARWLDVDRGGRVVVQIGLRDVTLRIAGHANATGNARYAVMDIAAVQDRFDFDGRLTRIDLRLAPGADRADAQQRLQALLPAGVGIAPPATTADAAARFSRAYRVNLDVLALVALFTGAMLVYATQTLGVARRRTQFALLRTLGLSARRLVAAVLVEAGLVGIIGALTGLAIGYAIAIVALRQLGPDLGAGYFEGDAAAVRVDVPSLLLFAGLGILAALGGSALPALDASRAAPAAALKSADADVVVPARARPLAFASLALGVAFAFLPAVGELPVFGYFAIALILVGAILALPSLAQPLLRALPTPRRVPLALALAHLRATPGKFASMLAAVVASVALMAAMAIMVASFRQSLDDWLGVMLPADLYVRTQGDSAFLSSHDQRAISTLPGIARAEFMRATSIALDPARPRVVLLARDIDPAHAASRLALVGHSQATAPDAPPPAWINEAVADVFRLRVGETVRVPIAGRDVAFTVTGVWRDYARQQGAIVIERRRYEAITGDASVNEAALWIADGVSIADVRNALSAYAGDGERLLVSTPGELRRLSLATFDRTFAVTYALEAAAVVIGLAGLSAALVAQTLARRREFGMLRHLGMTRRRIAAMLAAEGALLAVVGVVGGLLLGFAISLILIHVVNRQSFHWGMDLHVPGGSLALLATVLVALATLAARFAARRATGIDAVRAVRQDW